ncbi:hypothetical protein F5Y12DRAFT_788400 [Xylaria sp. FL1777]|nr:hypothetical protein F5Y12DRAFT_788400 [Xylaria sp. FL1777]
MTLDSTSGTLAIWLCNGLVACLIIARLGLRRWLQFKPTIGDGWLVVALIFSALRVVGDYHMNKYGTPLSTSVHDVIVPVAFGGSTTLEMTAQEQSTLILAGKLMIATRVAIVVVVKPNRVLIVLTEISNIIADTMLFFLPILLILGAPISKYERASLPVSRLGAMLVFGLGAALIAVEIVRLVEGLQFTNMILNRIVWGSIEAVIATSITTLPTIYVLLRQGFEKQQKEGEESIHRDAGIILATRKATGERTHDEGWPLQNDLVLSNKPISTEMGTENSARKPMLWNSMQSPVMDSILLGSALSGAKDRHSWPKPKSTIPNLSRDSGIDSRISSRIRGTDDNLYDTLTGWVELEEADVGSAVVEASSPEPDDTEYRSRDILTATEINQGVHREWQLDQRPRIVTIPRRAKLDCHSV